MRYATLAILLLLGMFGMSASVVAEDGSAPVTCEVTGPAAYDNAGSTMTVTGTVGNPTFNYSFIVRKLVGGVPNGQYLYKGPYTGAGGAFSKVVNVSSLSLGDDHEVRIELTVTQPSAGYDELVIPVN